MRSDDNQLADPEPGLPFARPVVRRIVEQLFQEQSLWKTGALVDRVAQLHRERGGAPPPSPSFTVRRVLQDLKSAGLVSDPGHGWWQWATSSPDETRKPDDAVNAVAPTPEIVINDVKCAIRPEKELGSGTEAVYLYYSPNDRRLAEIEGRDVWECKIGRTGSNDAVPRILGQGAKTAISRMPIIGLVIRTDDSSTIERVLHASLRLIGAEVPNSPGMEWFITSPSRVEAWYAAHVNALAALSTTPSATR